MTDTADRETWSRQDESEIVDASDPWRRRSTIAHRPRRSRRSAIPDWLHVDWPVLVSVAVLMVVGLNMVYSSSYVLAHNSPLFGSDTYFLARQLIWAGIGLVGMIITMRVDYRRWRRIAAPALGLVVLMLAAVAFSNFGRTAYGAQRWLSLGELPAIQPSEFAKLTLILYYAGWLAGRGAKLRRFESGPLPFAALLLLVTGLVMMQPDYGSMLVIVVIAVTMFFLAGAQLTHMLAGLLVGGAALIFLASSAGYRAARIEAFLRGDQDATGMGWHALQANIALGSGGLFGLGLGASRQKFYYLYGAHTDSIYAVIGEELGLIGTIGVLLLFLFLAYRGYRIALNARDTHGALLAAGITSWITIQALLNMAVITSLVPFTGIPLPFISAGGSSLCVSMVAIGLLMSVSRVARNSRATIPRPWPAQEEA